MLSFTQLLYKGSLLIMRKHITEKQYADMLYVKGAPEEKFWKYGLLLVECFKKHVWK